jgi:hypothetical protein
MPFRRSATLRHVRGIGLSPRRCYERSEPEVRALFLALLPQFIDSDSPTKVGAFSGARPHVHCNGNGVVCNVAVAEPARIRGFFVRSSTALTHCPGRRCAFRISRPSIGGERAMTSGGGSHRTAVLPYGFPVPPTRDVTRAETTLPPALQKNKRCWPASSMTPTTRSSLRAASGSRACHEMNAWGPARDSRTGTHCWRGCLAPKRTRVSIRRFFCALWIQHQARAKSVLQCQLCGARCDCPSRSRQRALRPGRTHLYRLPPDERRRERWDSSSEHP